LSQRGLGLRTIIGRDGAGDRDDADGRLAAHGGGVQQGQRHRHRGRVGQPSQIGQAEALFLRLRRRRQTGFTHLEPLGRRSIRRQSDHSPVAAQGQDAVLWICRLGGKAEQLRRRLRPADVSQGANGCVADSSVPVVAGSVQFPQGFDAADAAGNPQ